MKRTELRAGRFFAMKYGPIRRIVKVDFDVVRYVQFTGMRANAPTFGSLHECKARHFGEQAVRIVELDELLAGGSAA